MSRTVTALYDTRAEAEAASQRLASAVDVQGRAKIIDKSSMGSGNTDFHRVPLSHEDRHSYGEGLRRGGFLLCAEVDSDEDTDKIVRLLEDTSSVDLDQREQSWRNEGWSPYSGAATGTSGTSAAMGSQPSSSGSFASGNVVDEEHIPIVEEQLVVGKREVHRGGARVRTYIREVPVAEQVTLREEHVSVERRPVNQQLQPGQITGDMLQERTIEVSEMAEEAVVAKEARVAEELVIKKTAEQHTETIQDTVRRTEVDVDEGTSGDRSAMGFGRDNRDSGTTGSTSDFARTDPDRGL